MIGRARLGHRWVDHPSDPVLAIRSADLNGSVAIDLRSALETIRRGG